MLRLFVALELPADIRQRLMALTGGVRGARWSSEEMLHLTLRFIGEVGEDEAADLDASLAEIVSPPIALSLEGVGSFGSAKGLRVLWAGVQRDNALLQLQARVEAALVRAGLEPEERKFSPHITLARLQNVPAERLAPYLSQNGLFRAGPVAIDHFTLFQSHRGKSGPVYEPLADYPLRGRPD